MTEDQNERIVIALERIADVLEEMAGRTERFAAGALIGVPLKTTATEKIPSIRVWHAAVYVPGGNPVASCAAKAHGEMDLDAALAAVDVPVSNRCRAPGCERTYQQLGAQTHHKATKRQ